mgnify:CR=1 FL=1
MFQYTLAVLDKTVRDIKAVGKSISVVTQIIYILYLSYAIIAGISTLWANIALLGVSVLYFAFHIYCLARLDEKMKEAKEGALHAYKTVKLAINGITLGMTLYGIYIAASEVSVITVVFAGLSTIGWMFGLLLELTAYFFENRKALFDEAFKADTAEIKETVTKPVTVVSDFIKKATGQKIDEEKPKPTRKRRVLDRLVAQHKERKKNEREKKREKAELKRQTILNAEEEKQSRPAKQTALKK